MNLYSKVPIFFNSKQKTYTIFCSTRHWWHNSRQILSLSISPQNVINVLSGTHEMCQKLCSILGTFHVYFYLQPMAFLPHIFCNSFIRHCTFKHNVISLSVILQANKSPLLFSPSFIGCLAKLSIGCHSNIDASRNWVNRPLPALNILH